MRSSSRLPLRARALMFDMDGTMVLSQPVIRNAWKNFAQRNGLDFDAVFDASHGRQMRDIVTQFLPEPDRIEEEMERILYDEMTGEGVSAVPGIHAMLATIPRDRWAVVTSATRDLAINRMRKAGITPPPILIAAEDVTRGKPDPEGYLAAAAKLNVTPSDIIIFEDAPAGLEAARRSGATVVHLDTMPPLKVDHVGLSVPDYRGLQSSVRDGLIEIGRSSATA